MSNMVKLTIAVVHDDAKLALFSLEDLNEGYNVWVIERLKQARFLHSFFLFAFGHATNINHLHDAHVGVLDAPDQKGLTEGALAQQFDFLVGFEFGTLLDPLHLQLRIHASLFELRL